MTTIVSVLTSRTVTPSSGFGYGSIDETIRFTEEGGDPVTIQEVLADPTTPVAGDTNPVDSAYRIKSISFTQSLTHAVDAAVNYSDMPAVAGGSSTQPQQVVVSQPGYISQSTYYYTQFVDVYKRDGTGVVWWSPDPGAPVGDPGYVGTYAGYSIGQGNVDSGGVPISWPMVCVDLTISITRQMNLDPTDDIPWGRILDQIGKRYSAGAGSTKFLGMTPGTVLFTGAKVVQAYAESESVNYELTFNIQESYHLRQAINAFNDDGSPTLVLVEPAGDAQPNPTYHAADIKVIQPFPAGTGWIPTGPDTGLLSTEEYAILNNEVTT